jgi:uncharacterized membrane protein
MSKTYATLVGAILLIIGLLGFAKNNSDLFGLHFNTIHNTIHVLSGLIGLAAGLSNSAAAARAYALVFGAVYTLVAIVGFAHVAASINDMLMLNPLYNVIHLVVGLLGLAAGFTGGKEAAPA